MKELSVFIDESGDFGEYDFHSPYYIVSMVFHDQSFSIQKNIVKLDQELLKLGLHHHCIHTGPIIRKEEDYKLMTIFERRRIFNKFLSFIRQIDIQYKCFYIEKKHIDDAVEAAGKLSKSISEFIRSHYDVFLSYDFIKVFYDNGQIELTKILSSTFNALLPNAVFYKVEPINYKLFQVSDLFCTMKLINLKLQSKNLSKSETTFFGNTRDLRRNYIKPLKKKEWL